MSHQQPLARRKHRTVQALPEGLSFCPICGVGFVPENSMRIYCDEICRRIAFRRRVEAPRRRSKRESEANLGSPNEGSPNEGSQVERT